MTDELSISVRFLERARDPSWWCTHLLTDEAGDEPWWWDREDDTLERFRFPVLDAHLELEFHSTLSQLNLLMPGAQPAELGWDDDAHFHPHVFRWIELTARQPHERPAWLRPWRRQCVSLAGEMVGWLGPGGGHPSTPPPCLASWPTVRRDPLHPALAWPPTALHDLALAPVFYALAVMLLVTVIVLSIRLAVAHVERGRGAGPTPTFAGRASPAAPRSPR